jgi:hypothetical protein
MAKTRGMHHKSDRKQRGRTNISNVPGLANSTAPRSPVEGVYSTTRPISSGGGKHRGDRRDMSKTYSDTSRHASRGSNQRPDVKTRKR